MATLTLQTPEEKTYFENKGQTPDASGQKPPQKPPEETQTDVGETPEKGRDEKGRFVPLPALQEERRERQASQARERELADKYARLEERTNTILKNIQTEEEAIPEWEKDPLNHTKARLDQKDRELGELKNWKDDQEKQGRTAQQFNQFYNQVQTQIGSYMQEHPEYAQAHNHYFGEVAADMKDLGYSQTQIDNYIRDSVLAISAKAMEDGVNPASRIHAIAKRRGFKPSEQNGKDQTAEEKVKALASNQQAARSLGSTPGGKGAELNAKALAEMSQEEFAKVWMNKSARRKLLS